MEGAPVVLHGRTAPQGTYDVEVELVAPREPGLYQGFWQMRTAGGLYFGDRLSVGILVPPLPTPAPTSTQPPVTTIQFELDRSRVTRGECATFSWTVAHAQAAYFYVEGEAWQARGVPFVVQRTVCPEHTATYLLRVVRGSGWVDVRRLVLHVEQPPEAPQIVLFETEPGEQVSEGGCVDLEWAVEGQIARVVLSRDQVILWDDIPLSGGLRDCPPGSGETVYTLEATGPGGTTRAQRTIRIGALPTPTPGPLSGTEWQVLAIGGSLPAPAPLPLTVIFGQQDAAGQGTVAGWGGCNTYSAAYRQSGALLTIGLPTAGSVTCATDIMVQEQSLLEALHSVASLSWSEGQLTLWNPTGEVVLNLAASEAAGP
jgi:heat shock protein HslJ